MSEYATYSYACFNDDHEGCFDRECDCQCHDDADEASRYRAHAADGDYDRSWGY